MLGWCMDANDLNERLDKDMTALHAKCRHGQQTSRGSLECDCWCHGGTAGIPGGPKKTIKRNGRSVKATTLSIKPDNGNSAFHSGVKLNKDGSVPKKRGRPKGSKNKPKVNA